MTLDQFIKGMREVRLSSGTACIPDCVPDIIPIRRTITPAEWKRKQRHGYASTTNGQRYVLALGSDGATTLEPVRVIGWV